MSTRLYSGSSGTSCRSSPSTAIGPTAPLPPASDALPAGFAGARGAAVRFGRVAAAWAAVFFALRAGTLEGALGAALAAAADNSAGRDSEAMPDKDTAGNLESR